MDAKVGVQERARRGGIAEPAAHQDLGEDLAHAELPGEPPDICERRRRDAPGAGIVHECITARVYRAAATEAAGRDSGGLAGPAGVVRLGPGPRALARVRLRRGVVRRRSTGHGDGGLLAGGALGGRLLGGRLGRRVADASAASSATTVSASSDSTAVTASSLTTVSCLSGDDGRGSALHHGGRLRLRDDGRGHDLDGGRRRGRRRARGQSLGLAQPLVGGLQFGFELASRSRSWRTARTTPPARPTMKTRAAITADTQNTDTALTVPTA